MNKAIPYIAILALALAVGLPAETPEELIRQGDELFARRGEPGCAARALARYQEALRLAPDNIEALVGNARALYFVGDASSDKGERLSLFKQAMEASKKMISLRPDRVEGHYWLGVHTGMYGETRGVLKSLFLKNDIIAAMKRAIAVDPAYENAGAYCVLGRLYYKVPGLFGGSNKKSRQYLESCRGLAPKSSVCLLFLAETYWALGERDKAIQTLEELLAMEPDPLWVPETAKDKKAGAQLLKKYKK
ncbi:MAG: tetratricopeptide repeat protein [Candidatus Aminicenantes bacterium]|nr:tetratricopeptide repeat protein [Candidatus Aminicenantes bacterium]